MTTLIEEGTKARRHEGTKPDDSLGDAGLRELEETIEAERHALLHTEKIIYRLKRRRDEILRRRAAAAVQASRHRQPQTYTDVAGAADIEAAMNDINDGGPDDPAQFSSSHGA